MIYGKFQFKCSILIIALICFDLAGQGSWIVFGSSSDQAPMTLWYRQPANQWVEALAVGNGRLGAMVFGGVDQERLQLNEDTLWAGGPYDPNHAGAAEALPNIRQLIFAGKYREADRLVAQRFMATPLQQLPYQTLGNLNLVFSGGGEVANYRRELNLDNALARVSYQQNGVSYLREVFASPVDQVIVVRLSADQPGKIGFTLGFTTPQRATVSTLDGHTLQIDGVNGAAAGIAGALKFQVRIRVVHSGGEIEAGSDTITVRYSNSALLLVAAATSFVRYDDVSGNPIARNQEVIQAALNKNYEALLSDHAREHQRLFQRVKIDLGRTPAADLPTDERVQKSAELDDPALAALYFQFGRYLLISSSRPGTQPANLQGIWNESRTPPWGSKYTININTEMNYWPAEPTSLSECVEPLIQMVKELAITGKRTAKVHYGVDRGWVTHHNTDLWRATAPIDGPTWGIWPTGGAWLSKHLWEHYEYNGDLEYLKDVYPILKGAAEFFLATLVEEPTHGWLVTSPSISPENQHPHGAAICAGPTMDNQILRDIFTYTIETSKLLNTDAELRQQIMSARAKLPPNQIGAAGQLQEWLADWDMQAPEIHHRHVSHLYGLYPSDQIHVRDTPELAAAVRKSLEIRGDETTGWGIGWRLNLWAWLQDAEHTYKILKLLLHPSRTYPNLFDAHPPFQIDGNFGGVSGITAMLMQSRCKVENGGLTGQIDLLPALPAAFPTGSISGLRAKAGFDLDVSWKDGKLVAARIHSTLGHPCKLYYRDKTRELTLKAGETCILDENLNLTK